MLSRQEEDRERRQVLKNDARVRDQQGVSAYIDHQHDEMLGRFSQIGATNVIGSTAVPQYPAASAHQRDPVPIEPPLGYRIDDLNPSDPVELPSFSQQETGDPTAPSSTIPLIDDVERVGSPLSPSGDPAGASFASPTDTLTTNVDAGSLPAFRRF
jgi:hypothetical protein